MDSGSEASPRSIDAFPGAGETRGKWRAVIVPQGGDDTETEQKRTGGEGLGPLFRTGGRVSISGPLNLGS